MKSFFLPIWYEALKQMSFKAPGPFSLKKLVTHHREDLKAMRDCFNKERSALGHRFWQQPQTALLYLLGFHLPNLQRVLSTGARLEKRLGAWPLPSQVSLWDLGCGTGSMAQALLSLFPVPSHYYLYDRSSKLLKTAKLLLEQQSLAQQTPLTLFPRKVSLDDLHTHPRLEDHTLHLVAMGYLWNEIMFQPRSQDKIRALLSRLFRKPAMIWIMDSAQDFISRSLMKFRDELLSLGWKVVYPCPHQMDCPLLQSSQDWCYSEFLPTFKETQWIDTMTGVKRTTLASTSLIFVSPSWNIMKNLSEPVVIGRPLSETGKRETLFCSPSGQKQKTQRPPLLRGQTFSLDSLGNPH